MKLKVLIGGLLAALLIVAAGCSSTGTANKTTTNTTTTSTTSNTANRSTSTNTSNTSTSNTSNTSTSNTSAPSDAAEGKQDFTLHNETGVEIHSLYVSPHDKDEWGPDILGRDTLADGQSVEITFSPKEKAANWDLKVTDQSDNSIEWENLNLMEISEVTLHYNHGKGTAEVK
jgi:cytoskeletal protein RodZ